MRQPSRRLHMERAAASRSRASAGFALACLLVAGCSGGSLVLPSDLPLPTGGDRTARPTPADVATPAQSLGAWNGTITFHAVLAWDNTSTENGTYADEP